MMMMMMMSAKLNFAVLYTISIRAVVRTSSPSHVSSSREFV